MKEENNLLIARKENGALVITEEGKKELSQLVTNTESSVYAFSSAADPLMAAAAMARLSRRGDDMRGIMLDEFVGNEREKMEGLFRRVITAYGDDSVQQLMPIFFVVENASQLLTKALEWGRLAAYLEQSTRYIYFDQKDAHGNYRYYTPPNLDEAMAVRYKKTIDTIFDFYSEMVRGLTEYVQKKNPEPEDKSEKIAWRGATRAQACDVARLVLPVATTSTVGIMASAQSVETMIMDLSSQELREFQDTARSVLAEVRKVAPVFFERADRPERGAATVNYWKENNARIRALAKESLSMRFADAPEVTLVRHFPEQELDVVPEILFSSSALSLEEITKEVDTWGEKKKEDIFKAYVGERYNRRHKPGRAFELLHYEWELLIDYGIFRDLQRHRMLDMPEWQALTPAYGYEVPELVAEAGYEESFRKCFVLSSELFSILEERGFPLEAQYATLLGHRMRFRFMENARQAFHFHELRTTPQGHPGYRRVVKAMHEQLRKVHPRVANAMKFVNTGEDPELTRIAAERATQAKLSILDN